MPSMASAPAGIAGVVSTGPIVVATGPVMADSNAENCGGYAQRERGRLRVDRLRAPDERKTVTGLGA